MNDSTAWPILIEPEWLNDQLQSGTTPTISIWDLTTKESYQEGHLENAIFVNFAQLRSGEPPVQGLLPSNEQLTEVFSQIGLKDDTHIVLYDDDGGGKSGRTAWTLDVIGHHNYSVINGGIMAWKAKGLPLSSSPTEPSATDYPVTYLTDELVVSREWLLEHLDNEQLIVWDARSPQEFDGSLARATKAGHIPGAVNYEWTRAMQLDNNRTLRPLEEIKGELEKLGITPDKTVVTHCQTHHRSGFTYLLGKILGFKDIRAYPGSWAEWGNHPDTPVER